MLLSTGTGSHFIQWVGHFHPPLTEFPIAMLIGAALAELIRVFRGPAWLDGASRWCVIVGAIGAVITVPLGWAFAVGRGSSTLLEIHRWLGTTAGAGAVVILILSESARRRPRGPSLAIFRTVLFIAVPLVLATGFVGGAMVYGIHEYDWNPPHPSSQASSDRPATQPASQPVTIEMTDDFVFKPDQITITAGTSVRWKNISKESHTVTMDASRASDAGNVSLPAGASPFDSGAIKPGGSFEYQFTVPGLYKYICQPHEAMGMIGKIEVKSAAK